MRITASILKLLYRPAPYSHKGQNGILCVVGGSEKYHGAPLLAIKAASRFVDLVYFHSPAKLDEKILLKLKSKSNCFIAVPKRDLFKTIEKSDCMLVGNGLEVNSENKRLVNTLLKRFAKTKKMVLDAGALRMADKKLFSKNVLVTPHSLEFEVLFGANASPEEAKRQAHKWNCVILLKQRFCFVTEGKNVWKNANGNEGMTKGGTGDVLAGLCAAFACKNDLLSSAQAAAFVNGFTGDVLYAIQGSRFDADDLAESVAFAFNQALEEKR